jgi:sec-independent protein translocase protein TatC
MSLFLAIMFSMPLILWELGKFFKPALKPKEKRIVIKTIIPATLLFITGCMFAFFIIIPFTIKFLLHIIVGLDSQALITVDSFMKFIILFTLAFGLAFELPIIMYGLSRLGIVSSRFWRQNWRYAFIIFIIFGGVITPDGSGITQLMIAVPMLGLYFCGYAAVRIKEKGNKK